MSRAIEVLSRGVQDIGSGALDWYQKKALAEQQQAQKQQDLQRYLGVMDNAPLRQDETPIDERNRQINYLRAGGDQANLKTLPFGAGDNYFSYFQKKKFEEDRAKAQADLVAQRLQGSMDLQDKKGQQAKELEATRNANRNKSQEDKQKHDKEMVKQREESNKRLIQSRASYRSQEDERKRSRMQQAHENAVKRIEQANQRYANAKSEGEQKAALADLKSANDLLNKVIVAGGTPTPKPKQETPREQPKKIKAGNLEFSNQKAANVWIKATPEQRRALAQKYGGFKQARDAIEAATK